ncbi:MAG: LPXTG cell wall anchor domain-containing protein [Thermoleophilaceae bacterium]
MTKRTTYLILGALLALAAMATPALAQTTAPTSVSLSYEDPNFVGTVSSPNPDCEPGRSVTLFERQVGGGAEAVGSTTSQPGGDFSIPQPGADGQYFVTVSARQLPDGYGAGSCEAAQSETVPAGSGILGGAQEDDDDDDAAAGLPFTGTAGIVGFTALGALLVGAGLLMVRRNRARSTAFRSTT